MKQTYSFGIYSEDARIALGSEAVSEMNGGEESDAFTSKGIVGDPLYLKLQEADHALEKLSRRSLIGGWNIKRTSTVAEIESAHLLLLKPDVVQGAAKEYGTWYTDGVLDETCVFERRRAVSHLMMPYKTIYAENTHIRCALSSRQVGPLRFPFRKIRKGFDLFMLWGGEYVISERLAKILRDGNFTGGKVRPIWNTGINPRTLPDLSDTPTGLELLRLARRKGFGPADRGYWSWIEEDGQLPSLDRALWEQMELQQSRRAEASATDGFLQLIIQSTPLAVADKTLFGESPFRPGSGESCKCRFGEIRGKRLLSHLSVLASSWDGSDICISDLYWMGKAGLFRPWRLLVFSKRLFDAMRQANMKGFEFEVVEMV